MRTGCVLADDGGVKLDIIPVAPPARPTAWSRAFPILYDPFLWLGERTGVRALRHNVLANARGDTVEIGSGTGLNLRHYPTGLSELVLLEPDPLMRSRLERRVAESGRRAQVVDAPAERLPFGGATVDTVVSTFVLCTVEAPELAVREIMRVLRPGGQLLFIEHVRSNSATLALWQDRLVEAWSRFAKGCRCNRAIGELIGSCGFGMDDLHEASWHAMPPIVRPLIAGRATKGVGDE